jgi:hypothetical protein
MYIRLIKTTYLLTPFSIVIPDMLTGSQLVMKLPALYGTPKVHHRVYKSLPLLILSRIKSVHEPHPTA